MAKSIAPVAFNFNSHEVRTIHKDNVVWFVASDIAKTLNYAEAKDMVRHLDEDETGRHTVPIRSENGTIQDREVLLINESGLYHALFKSRKPEAQAFRKWVTSEVLPSIRKTGEYKNPPSSNGLTIEQQNVLRAIVKARAESLPDKSKWAGAKIRHWSALKSVYGVAHKDIPANEFLGAVNILARVVLEGELIDAKPKGMLPLLRTPKMDSINATYAYSIIANMKDWTKENLPYDIRESVLDSLQDLQRVISSSTTEMQEAIVHFNIGIGYLNRFRR